MHTQTVEKKIDQWLEGPYDEATKETIRSLKKNHPEELYNAFCSRLSFGTGGIRALMGVGTSRLNSYTIFMISQGLAEYILEKDPISPSVVISFDSRHHSKEFAENAAQVFAAHGISVILFNEMRPVAYTSFACRHYECTAAVMITASHNPKEYNGYKIFWSDGGQVVAPHDSAIAKKIDAISDLSRIKIAPPSHPLIQHQSLNTLDEAFLQELLKLRHLTSLCEQSGKELKITYTSLHGTGYTTVPKALHSWGFTNINPVEEQMIPDGNFPTVKFPNPEYDEALSLGKNQLLKTHSDLLIANDPDADRMGVVVLHKGEAVRLTGNEMAAICVDFLCRFGNLPKNSVFITTIVTTQLVRVISEAHHFTCFEVLTGFKYIGEKIHLFETTHSDFQFIFGSEESCGCLLGTYARDKDATIGSCLIAEIALYAKKQGKTLIDLLDEIYTRYGIFKEELLSLDFPPGEKGMQEMQNLMKRLRNAPPSTLANAKVLLTQDYLSQSIDDLPLSDVLSFQLEGNIRLVIRPSGTEPKIKIYASLHLKNTPSLEEGKQLASARLSSLLNTLKNDLCSPS